LEEGILKVIVEQVGEQIAQIIRISLDAQQI